MEKKRAARSSGGLINRIYKNRRGQVRALIVLAMALAVLAACLPLVEWLYWSGFNALMRLWGVTERNIARAPWAVRQFARYSGVLLTLIQAALLLALSRRLARWKALGLEKTKGWPSFGGCIRGLTQGAGSLFILWLALLAIDNVRLGRSLLHPHWSVDVLILSVSAALWAAASLAWGVGLVYRLLSERIPWPAAAAAGALLLAPLLLDSKRIDAMLVVNLLLCGATCCLSAREKQTWSWGAGFLCGLWLPERALLGFPGYSAALYETYPVNYFWINGGEAGLWHGAAMTLLLLVNAAILLRPRRGKSAS